MTTTSPGPVATGAGGDGAAGQQHVGGDGAAGQQHVGGDGAAGQQHVGRWERSAETLWRRSASGVVVLPNDSSAASCLEGLHAALWLALARPMSVDVLVDNVDQHLDEDPGARRRVVAEAIRFLVAMGAVRESHDR